MRASCFQSLDRHFDFEFFKLLILLNLLLNEHGNIICAKKSFIEAKIMSVFLNKMQEPKKVN